jgi:methionyl-tRNA formyltransferase
MNLVYFSKGVRGRKCLEAVLSEGYQVLAVVAVEDDPGLVDLVAQANIPILIPERVNSEAFAEELRELGADLFVLSGYNRILKPLIIEIPPRGTINLHGGKLPEFRGAAPINWQIIEGETEGGCAIIFVDEGIDTGDIIRQELYPIEPEDTHASVLDKTLKIFPRLLLNVLEEIQVGQVSAQAQDPREGAYYTRRYPRDSRIDWQKMSDVQVHNLVRGMRGPYPAAFTFREGQKIEIGKTRLLEEVIKGIPGRVPMFQDGAAVVLARNRGLLVEKVVVDGKEMEPGQIFKIGDDLR